MSNSIFKSVMEIEKKASKILMIAGPNGAGKTTFAREFLPKEGHCLIFINADLIAAGLSPFRPETQAIMAGKLMLAEMNKYVRQREGFAFETTLSGLIYAKKIPIWQNLGYKVKLIFLSLPNVDMAIQRVNERVKQGGHFISEKVIRRRLENGYKNFIAGYKFMVDEWLLLDNSHQKPIILDSGEKNE